MKISIQAPDDLYDRAVQIAETKHVPVDEVFTSVFVDQMAAWNRLLERAKHGTREGFLAVLDKAPDVEPEEHDRR